MVIFLSPFNNYAANLIPFFPVLPPAINQCIKSVILVPV